MRRKQTACTRWAFLFFILLLPVQLGFHFWPKFAYVFGIRVDYLSPTIYLTDIALVGVLGLCFFERAKRRGLSGFSVSPTGVILASLFLYLLGTSVFIAENQGAAFYKLARLIELSFLFWCAYCHGSRLVKWKPFYFALSLAIIYPALIAIFQFFVQRSLGGLFWWLGERTFSVSTPGIALTDIWGREFLRSYGTFSHPNSMAGFLLLGLILLAPWRGALAKIALGFGTAGIILSFSQAAWFSALPLSLAWLMRKWRPGFLPRISLPAAILAIALSITLAFVGISGIKGSGDLEGRMGLFRAAGDMISHSPLFGVGLNNFIPRLPEFSQAPSVSWWLQPVHNIFLLILSETGIVGSVLVLYLAGKFLSPVLVKPKNLKYAGLLAAILITGLADHYWLTLWQNQLLATIALALAVSPGKA